MTQAKAMKLISPVRPDFFLKYRTFIDVRAPVEFESGHLPGASNLPLLDNNQRAQVGTVYKKFGQEAATSLGHTLISGEVKAERIQNWLKHLREFPDSLIYCARGGLRSQISQRWLEEAGCPAIRIEGGYKLARQKLLEILQSNFSVVTLGGLTGSGKSKLLNSIEGHVKSINLEELAVHRGSAFGKLLMKQPSQSLFENLLAVRLFPQMSSSGPLIVEDESRLIGKCCLPEVFYQQIRSAPCIFIEEKIENRTENILNDYVLRPLNTQSSDQIFSGFYASLKSISKKIGGLEYQKIFELMQLSHSEITIKNDPSLCREWILQLLKLHYDPIYNRSFERRNVKVLYRGSFIECKDFIKNGVT